MKYSKFLAALFAASFLVACDKDEDDKNDNNSKPIATVVQASGNLAPHLDQFRQLLGNTLNTAPGASGGRREVNWDGVPPALTNNNSFPADFFNNTDPAGPNGRKRGLVMVNNAAGFRVDSTDLAELDASYAAQFEAFSPKRIFIASGTNQSEAVFKVPGTATDAFVKGFGVVFSDVDNAASTTIEYFEGAKSLGVFKAPAASGSFSFLGVYFPYNKVTRVKITSGNGVPAQNNKDISEGGNQDLVVMDDFLYNEPQSYQ